MNPFFWFLVLIAMVAIWFLLRNLFVDIGSGVKYLLRDTRDVLESDEWDDSDIDNFENEKENNEV